MCWGAIRQTDLCIPTSGVVLFLAVKCGAAQCLSEVLVVCREVMGDVVWVEPLL